MKKITNVFVSIFLFLICMLQLACGSSSKPISKEDSFRAMPEFKQMKGRYWKMLMTKIGDFYVDLDTNNLHYIEDKGLLHCSLKMAKKEQLDKVYNLEEVVFDIPGSTMYWLKSGQYEVAKPNDKLVGEKNNPNAPLKLQKDTSGESLMLEAISCIEMPVEVVVSNKWFPIDADGTFSIDVGSMKYDDKSDSLLFYLKMEGDENEEDKDFIITKYKANFKERTLYEYRFSVYQVDKKKDDTFLTHTGLKGKTYKRDEKPHITRILDNVEKIVKRL